MRQLILFLCLFLPAITLADIESSLKDIDKSIRLREYDEAVLLLQPLLDKNVAEAQYRMAGLYRSGTGVKKDMKKAMEEYRKASLGGLDKAQFVFASLLEKRGTSKQKMIEIQKWYQAAADQGHRRAIEKLAAIESQISAGNNIEINDDTIFSAIRNNALDQVKSYIERGLNLDIMDINNRSPLMAALLVKNHEMSQLILSNSTRVNTPDSSHNYPLHLAASNGYADLVVELLDKKAKINARDELGNTALIIATRHDDDAIMSTLLDRDADHGIKNKKNMTAPQLAQILDLKKAKKVFQEMSIKLPEKNQDYARVDIKSFQSTINKNASLYKGWPLINIASLLGETTIVAQLLDQGVDINATDANGNNALHRAASKGQLKSAELLISRGINIDAINHKQQTAVYIAASTGQLKIINLLIKKGTNTALLAKNKTSPLSIAILNKHSKSALSLGSQKLDKPSIHRALLLAMQNNMEKLSIMLIKRDALLVFAYDEKRSALWHSANNGLIKTTTELLKTSSIDINLSDKNGYTALARAINNGFVEITNLLINKEADTNSLTNEGNSLLMLAALSGQSDIFKKILKLDKNLNAKDKSGDTALMLAASTGNTEFVELLIKSGADIQTRNQDDLNAYQIAINSGHDSTAKLIRESSGRLFKLFN